MPDLGTVIVSAAAGALSGATISWIAAPQLVGRQKRGEARAAAQQQINQQAEKLRTQVLQFRGFVRGNMGRSSGDTQFHIDDAVLCATFLKPSRSLGAVRRWAVRRRLRKLFGPGTVRLCEMHGDDATDPEAMVGLMLNRRLMMANSEYAELAEPDAGDFDNALRRGPNSKEATALARSLKRLADCM